MEGGDGLLVSQLFWGLGTQRYETYIGTEYLHPGMEFIDAIGRKILQEAGNIEYNLKELISIYFKHPLDCLGIYMRHFINAFDNRFPELYIKDLNKNRDLYVFINYTILYVWIFTVIMRGKERLKAGKKLFEYHNRLQILYLSVLVLPSLLTTAGALEIRFYMPVWFIIYTYIIFVTDYKKLLKKVREKPVQTAVSYLLGFAVLVSLWGGCMGTLLDGAIL